MWTIATAGCLSTIASTKAHFYPLMGFELDTNAECRAMQDMHYDLTKVKSSGDFIKKGRKKTEVNHVPMAVICRGGI